MHRSDEFFDGTWLLTRHEDVEAMLRNPRFSARRTGAWVMNSGEGARNELKGFQQLFARAMLFMDAPDHSRLRRVMQAGFRPDALQALRPLVARLARAKEDGTITDDAELLAQCAMLLLAGHETTRNLLGNGLYHLLARPGLWDELQREPGRLPGAVRELLRFDSPVQYTGRRVATDLVWHGQPLRRGDLVLGLIGSANRDPRRYAQPDGISTRSIEGWMRSPCTFRRPRKASVSNTASSDLFARPIAAVKT